MWVFGSRTVQAEGTSSGKGWVGVCLVFLGNSREACVVRAGHEDSDGVGGGLVFEKDLEGFGCYSEMNVLEGFKQNSVAKAMLTSIHVEVRG